MAILSDIRKRPVFLILIIGLALFAFVLSEVLTGNSGPSRQNIGSVNGEDISAQEFARRVDAQRNRGANTETMQTVNSVWNSLIREKIYDEQIKKAGIVIGEKDLWDQVVTIYKNSPQFQNEVGLFDENKLKEYIATLKENPTAWENWERNLENIKVNIKQQNYNDLIEVGLTASIKDGEREYNQNNKKFDVKLAFEPYSSIKNEEVNITDQEIKTYIKNHPKEFKVDASVELEFVKFDVKPSKEDIKKVKDELNKIIDDYEEYNENIKQTVKLDGFKNTKDIEEFINEYSDTPYTDKVYLKEDLPTSVYDTIIKMENNDIYGPIREGDYFKMYKKLGKEGVKFTKASHILLSYKGSQSAKPTTQRTKEEAEKEIKNLLKKVNESNFAEMAKKYSDGPSATKGGELGDFSKKGKFVKEFDEFIFNNPKGKIGIVETVFGYHIIKVDDVKTENGLKLAIVTRKIDPSNKTESDIYQQAETLASDISNGKSIEEAAKEKNLNVKKANRINPLTENINGIGLERDIVRWAFDKDTKIGEVKRFDLNSGDYAVVILKSRNKKGLTPVSEAKSKVLPILTKKKKAEIIRNKISGSTIEEKAKSLNKSVITAENVSILSPNLKAGGNDETVVGALLYMKEGEINVIDGKNGVYIIKIIKITEPYDIKKYDTYSKNISNNLKTKANKVFEALKKKSDIEDNRAEFY